MATHFYDLGFFSYRVKSGGKSTHFKSVFKECYQSTSTFFLLSKHLTQNSTPLYKSQVLGFDIYHLIIWTFVKTNGYDLLFLRKLREQPIHSYYCYKYILEIDYRKDPLPLIYCPEHDFDQTRVKKKHRKGISFAVNEMYYSNIVKTNLPNHIFFREVIKTVNVSKMKEKNCMAMFYFNNINLIIISYS